MSSFLIVVTPCWEDCMPDLSRNDWTERKTSDAAMDEDDNEMVHGLPYEEQSNQ